MFFFKKIFYFRLFKCMLKAAKVRVQNIIHLKYALECI